VLRSLFLDSRILPPAKQAERVRITEGPTIESANHNLVIIKWTSNNPGGTDEHFGVVNYGTDPEHLTRTAKSPVRLNQNHELTVFSRASGRSQAADSLLLFG